MLCVEQPGSGLLLPVCEGQLQHGRVSVCICISLHAVCHDDVRTMNGWILQIVSALAISLTATGNSHTIWDHTVLPATHLHPQTKQVIDLSTPEGCKAELTYVTWKRTSRQLNPRPVSCKPNTLLQCHHATTECIGGHQPSLERLKLQSSNIRMKVTFESGVVRIMRPSLNFEAPIDISGTAEARIVKFCIQVDCIKF